MRKLQVSLPDFRRLCIFKGIYPRQPRNRQKAAKNSTPSTTFYYAKDIQYLLHEPLLQKFRDHNALAKKIAKALGKGQDQDAARLERTHTPRMTLDHIVKERYPTFNDALGDLDDALSMLFLFANLPSHLNVPPKTIRLCQRLCHEFQHYLIISHSLRKSFLSIKGIYYQASIQGQDVLWLVPYNFVQRVTGDVDFRIMGTFVEFYTTLLGFVNYRLYTTAGLVYPPRFNASSDEKGAALSAFTPQARQLDHGKASGLSNEKRNGSSDRKATARAQAIADAVSNTRPANDEADVGALSDNEEEEGPLQDAAVPSNSAFKPQAPNADEADTAAISSSAFSQQAAELFRPFTFFLSRETPRDPLEFLLKAFGCGKIGWDEILGAGAFTHNERDEGITHQVVDRPPAYDQSQSNGQSSALRGRIPGRTYVQPQWIWDCVNACQLLPAAQYAPGASLPPHLSPFVKPKPGDYDPSKPLEPTSDDEDEAIVRVQDGREIEAQEAEDEEDLEISADNEVNKDEENKTIGGIQNIKGLGDLNGAATFEEEGVSKDHKNGDEAEAEEEFVGFSDSGAESDDYENELKAETIGKGAKDPQTKAQQQKHTNREKKRKQQADEAWAKDRQKMMMSRKQRELYGRMEYSNAQKDAASDKLRAKRRKLELVKG